jgi:transmembrane sensor
VAVTALAITVAKVAYRMPNPPQLELAAKRQPPPSPMANQVVRLSDGSTAVALDPATEIVVADDRPDRAELSLTRGRGRFDVKPRPTRTFMVHAGDVTIGVLGTMFTVERVADRVGISVESGIVRVDWGAGFARLREGQSGWYPPLVMSAPNGRAAAAQKPAHPPSVQAAKGPAALALSDEGSTVSVAAKRESAEDLLLAVDSARLAGHVEEAANLLRKLVRDHPGDTRAPLAAFTLGRMLLMELARPREAAAVFVEARRLSPGGPFAEDALAREVEAFSQAGLTAEAHARAQEYCRLYPNGTRHATVRTMGGIR